jgi:hypothetical protein
MREGEEGFAYLEKKGEDWIWGIRGGPRIKRIVWLAHTGAPCLAAGRFAETKPGAAFGPEKWG